MEIEELKFEGKITNEQTQTMSIINMICNYGVIRLDELQKTMIIEDDESEKIEENKINNIETNYILINKQQFIINYHKTKNGNDLDSTQRIFDLEDDFIELCKNIGINNYFLNKDGKQINMNDIYKYINTLINGDYYDFRKAKTSIIFKACDGTNPRLDNLNLKLLSYIQGHSIDTMKDTYYIYK